MQPVDEVDVGVAGCAEHRRVASRLPAPSVAGAILRPAVGLDLDDAPDAPGRVWPASDEARPEQREGEVVDRSLEEGPSEW